MQKNSGFVENSSTFNYFSPKLIDTAALCLYIYFNRLQSNNVSRGVVFNMKCNKDEKSLFYFLLEAHVKINPRSSSRLLFFSWLKALLEKAGEIVHLNCPQLWKHADLFILKIRFI